MFNKILDDKYDIDTIYSDVDVPFFTAYYGAYNWRGRFDNMLHGRRRITCDVSPWNLKEADIPKILENSFEIFRANQADILFLDLYYRGIQPILFRDKLFRPEIKNTIVENNSQTIVAYKDGSVGNPKYVTRGRNNNTISGQSNNITSEIIGKDLSILDNYLTIANNNACNELVKHYKNMYGHSYKFSLPNKNATFDNDLAPFIISVPHPFNSFAVEFNTPEPNVVTMGCYITCKVENNNKRFEYNVITKDGIYTYVDTQQYNFPLAYLDNINTQRFRLKERVLFTSMQIPLNYCPFHIYKNNPEMIGVFEAGIPLMDNINNIKSNQSDHVEQNVQSIFYTINGEIVTSFDELGNPQTNENLEIRTGDWIMLFQREGAGQVQVGQLINNTSTEIFTDIIDDDYNKLMVITGTPNLINGNRQGNTTGQAAMITSGVGTISGSMAKSSSEYYIASERQWLDCVIRFTKAMDWIDMPNIKLSDIEIKLPFDKNFNVENKTNAMVQQIKLGIDPTDAINNADIFDDSNEVAEKSKPRIDRILFVNETINVNESVNENENENLNSDTETVEQETITETNN